MPCTGTLSVFFFELIRSSCVCACAYAKHEHSNAASALFMVSPLTDIRLQFSPVRRRRARSGPHYGRALRCDNGIIRDVEGLMHRFALSLFGTIALAAALIEVACAASPVR